MKKRADWLFVAGCMVIFGLVVVLSGLKTAAILNKGEAFCDQAIGTERGPLTYLIAGASSPLTMENRKIKTQMVRQKSVERNAEVLSFFSPDSAQPSESSVERATIRLIPGGQSIGVKVNTKGVLVVGYHLIDGVRGQASPGESAGIRVGDVITKINGHQIRTITDVRDVIRSLSVAHQPLKLAVLRQKTLMVKRLDPVQDRGDHRFQLGLYIRDSASGIGTMTFFDPESHRYGALGHVISDHDTGQPILVDNGRIVQSSVQAIDKGEEGKPGEKIAFFPDNATSIGTVEKNTPFGIYGHMRGNHSMRSLQSARALPIALSSEVKEGPAEIRTVVNGDRVQTFHVRILNSISQRYPATKGLVIKITDPKLLRTTGGIIQGMSGSPIIQNGKLVGAVTHVFVNDPTCGYGVHIEWMLDEAGLNSSDKKTFQDFAS
ncbi:MAG: SpoIVB peptidase [Sporolactobacillus sp.]